MKGLDLRDTGLREVARQTTNIIAVASRGKKTTPIPVNNQIKEIKRVPGIYGYQQRSVLGRIGR